MGTRTGFWRVPATALALALVTALSIVPSAHAQPAEPPIDVAPTPVLEVVELSAALDAERVVTLAWLAPATDAVVLDYVVSWSADGGATWLEHPDPVTPTTGATATMPADASWIWRVQVVADGAASVGVQVLVTTPPEPTSVPAAVPSGAPSEARSLDARFIGARTMTLTWQSPSSAGSSAILDYRIAISRDEGTTWVTQRDPIGPVTRYTFGVQSGTPMLVRVVAVNAAGESAPQQIAVTSPALSAEALESESALRAALVARMASLPGRYSVSVREIGGLDREVHIDAMRQQEPASVMKLFAAYAVLDRIERKALSLSTATRSGVSIGSCLRVMIHISDNLCHWDLVAKIGNQRINDTLAYDGFIHSVYQGRSMTGRYFDTKRTTTSNVSLMLHRLETDSLLADPQADHLRDLLLTQLWRHRVPSGVPVGVAVANKTGQLWVTSGMIEADAAIVYGPETRYAISIIGSQNASGYGVRILGQIVYEHLNGNVVDRATYSSANLVTTQTAVLYRYAGRIPLRGVPEGTRLIARYSARLWYQVTYNGNTYYVHSGRVRNVYDYPRPAEPQ
ncbi:serine hydrolase [Microcella humidisoli]|uniref:Serine hydrolase n=1 Tax=Microcella humidisoli TaxID=2963406 RepID=A0ABY5FXG2_9MICO|nr:serine hydrolase [Microcella humidisoli]UTT62997.1 serine hydrolase [Microcella humidisoli]